VSLGSPFLPPGQTGRKGTLDRSSSTALAALGLAGLAGEAAADRGPDRHHTTRASIVEAGLYILELKG